MARVAWQATVHGVTKSQTQLSDLTLFFFFPKQKIAKENNEIYIQKQ